MRFVLFSLLIISCAQPLDVPTVDAVEAVEEEQAEDEPVEEAEHVWSPDDNTVYVLEGEAIIYGLYCTDRNKYRQKLSAARQMVELHNREYANEWRVTAGPCTWETI